MVEMLQVHASHTIAYRTHVHVHVYRWSTVHVTMQGCSVWWSVTREQCILEGSIRKGREESQVRKQ